MTDHMPFRLMQVPQGGGFPGKFLYAVLTENPEPSVVGLANTLRRKRLAYRHQRDFFGISPGTAGGGRNPLAHFGRVLGDGHVKTVNHEGRLDLEGKRAESPFA